VRGATEARWAEAQQAERSFWDTTTYKPEVFSATLASIAEASTWMQQRMSSGPPGGHRVELGIGPMGLGCVQLLPRSETDRLVGVDPLEQTPAAEWPLPESQSRILTAFQRSYEHVVARAEDTGLEGERFGVAVLHNMLDHVQDPAAVLSETRRLLRPDGLLLLACDTISLANRVRLKVYAQKRFADSIFVKAHPFHFRVIELLRLVPEAGFRVLADNRRRPRHLYETVGRSHRLLLLAEKA
jgi:SAM-dependent methyltransferase